MATTMSYVQKREKETGKKAYTGYDVNGELHYAFSKDFLNTIINNANMKSIASNPAAFGYGSAKTQTSQLPSFDYSSALQNSLQLADKNNQFNADQAQKQMDFQERMSSTAHQREVKDLISAGLNPILSAGGSGASTPGGSSATADTSATTLQAQMMMKQMEIGAQLEMNKQNIESAQKMAKWSNDLNKELGYAGFKNQEAMANISAAAAMYGANTAASASRYATDNPNDPLMYFLKDIMNNKGSKTSAVAKSIQKKATDYFNSWSNNSQERKGSNK